MSSANKLLALTFAFTLLASAANAQGVRELRTLNPKNLDAVMAEPLPAEGEEEVIIEESDATNAPIDVSEPAPIAKPERIEPAISVQPVSHISLDTLGLYDESNGGLSQKIWDNTDHARAELLLNKLPDSIPADAIRQLVARLLLTSATGPQSANIQQNIFRPRIHALLQIGEAAQVKRLIELAPKDRTNETLNRLEYTTHLLNNEPDWVCQNIASTLSGSVQDIAFWKKISIFCLARANKEAEAQLALDSTAEQSITYDDGFHALVDTLLGRTKTPEKRFTAPVSLEDGAIIALSGKDAFPEGYLASAPLPIASLVSENVLFPAEQRAVASKRVGELKITGKRTPAQQTMQDFYKQQFSQSTDRKFDFDAAVKTAQQRGGEADAVRRAYRFYSMLQGLGFEKLEVADAWHSPNHQVARAKIAPWLRAELATAVDGERLGESILLLASVSGQVKSLADMDDDTLADLVQALVQLGLTKEANALAVEAMVSLY
ncbi:MAG: hypothetical protein FJX23_07140 [Alphaproteobacteria bacterium]|nr:hypothetical protein [Alphaproteobacteria bacterium]